MKALVLLSSLGVISLLAEIFSFKKLLYPLVLIGLITTFVLNIFDWDTNELYFNMMRYDNYAVAFTSVILVIAFLWFLMSESFFKEETSQADHFALVLFALVGAVIMVSYTNMTMLFLGIEILSISMYVLAGSKKDDVASNEAAFKYLIMGSFATGFLLFGVALIYGSTGSFDLMEIRTFISSHQGTVPAIFYAGVLLMLIGLAFKVSAAPFHFWAPDVYQGAPTVITAIMATIVKTAAFAAFLRLFSTTFAEVSSTWVNILWVMAALTLLVGNITAVLQTNTKRMLAYSSVAHAGYMLLALLAGNQYSNSAILFYTAAYSIGSIGTFCILNIVSTAKGNINTDAFKGLGKSNPFLAFVMTVALLSLAGIPPTAGFFAKYYIFTAAFQAGYAGLVLIAIIASLVGVYYYFKIIIAMYFKEGKGEVIEVQTNHKLLLALVALLILALGLFPDYLIGLL
ncbi:MAG: NADH dehydrogenase [Bacteroidetes bacterium RIFCSPLOWO2_12_FULL_35_15]|nr:MAG: NADH dehydrogenase [Bacteroidetes bacterium RIFCSPLOWO2_12_FULL_35_15]